MKQFIYRCSVLALVLMLLTGTALMATAANAASSSNSSSNTGSNETSSKKEEVVSYDPNITLTARYDYDDKVRAGFTIPVFIEIENKGEEIDGEIRLLMTPQDSKEAVEYKMNVHVDANGKANYVLPFQAASTRNIQLFLYQDGKAIARAKMKSSGVALATSGLIGILSENPQDVAYMGSLKNIGTGDKECQTAIAEMSAGDFPEEAILLKRFAVIVLNHYDINLLNEKQRNALTKWVNNGGVVLADADAANKQAVESLSLLVDGLTVQGESSSEGVTKELCRIANVTHQDQKEISSTGEVSPQGKLVYGIEGKPLLMKYEVGRGRLFLTTFSLGEEVLSGKGLIGGFLENVDGINAISRLEIENSLYNTGYSLTEAVSGIEWLDAAPIGWILVLGIFFIVLAGPVNYIILAIKDKRDWIWITAPVLGIIFCTVIVWSGYQQHGSVPVSSIMTVVDTRIGHEDAISEIGIGAHKNGEFKIALSEKGMPSKATYNSYYEDSIKKELEPGTPGITFDVGGQTEVTFPNISRWKMDSFTMTRDLQLEGGLQAKAMLAKDSVEYWVKNETGTDLEDVTLTVSGGFVRIPLLKNNEEKVGEMQEYGFQSGAGSTAMAYGGLDYWVVLMDLYGGANASSMYFGSGGGDEEEDTRTEEEQRLDYIKYSTLTPLMNNGMGMMGGYYGGGGNQQKMAVWGWSTELGDMELDVNGTPAKKMQNLALVLADMDIAFGTSTGIYIPPGFIMGTVLDSNMVAGNAYAGATYCDMSEGEVTFQLQLPTELSDYEITNLTLSLQEGGSGIEFFTKDTASGDWVPYKLGSRVSGELIKNCVNENNILEVKVLNNAKDSMQYLYGLTIEIEGKVK